MIFYTNNATIDFILFIYLFMNFCMHKMDMSSDTNKCKMY